MPTLSWIGKEKVINHHRDVPFKILEHKYGFNADKDESEEPVNNGNKIIHGDNLEALKSLLPEYEGKIKCIYIDPPYNTGNENWVYNDNVNHPKIRKWLETTLKAKENGKEAAIGIDDLARHDKWLCMMYPRLQLLHKLLDKDGAIFISIDDNEQAYLKLICDEIFGNGNFIANVIWQHTIQAKNDVKTVSLQHNYTLIYKKATFQIGKIERTEEHNVAYSNPDNDPYGTWRSGDVRSPNLRLNLKYDIETPSGKLISPPEKGWRWDKHTVLEKIKNHEIVFNKDETKIIRKIYLKNQTGRVPESIWFGNDVETTRDANRLLKEIFKSEIPFNTPKPNKLIERIIQLSTEKNSIILDSFAGSGTTAHAVLNLNKLDGGTRKFILIEMEDYADSITAERVKRVIKGYADKEGTGGSFDYYMLGKPIFTGENNELLNEEIGTDKIREYIWFSETRTSYDVRCTIDDLKKEDLRVTNDELRLKNDDLNNRKSEIVNPKSDFKSEILNPKSDNPYFLGKKDGTAYYFIYEKEILTTLDYDLLSTIKSKAGQYVIYADNCLLAKDFMMKHNIIFKKIPRDITRF